MTPSPKSDFEVKVVRVGEITKHPGADNLEIINVFDYPVVSRIGTFKTGDLAVYVPVDAVVPTDRPEFAFLAKEGKTTHRIKAMRLRKVFSMGLLVPLQEKTIIVGTDFGQHYATEGSEVADALGISKYVNPQEARLEQHQQSNEARARARAVSKGPKLPVYGLDPLRKYSECLPEGELVVVTEKIHGCNARYVLSKGRLWVGSHKVMRGCSRSRFQEAWDKVKLWALTFFGQKHRAHTLRDMGDVWWQIAEKFNLKDRLRGQEDFVLYGEIYGQTANGAAIQSGSEGGKKFNFSYDAKDGVGFRAFDVYDLKAQKFLDFPEFEEFIMRLNEVAPGPTINLAPVLQIGAWSKDLELVYRQMADEGKTPFANANGHLGEGVVIKPLRERMDPRCGRVALKFAGARYLLSQDE